MSDPIPSAKAHPDPDGENENLRTNANAEDRKAAAALSSMQTNEIGAESVSENGVNAANRNALNNAMGRLEITAGQGSGKGSPAKSKPQVAAKKPTVKVTEHNVALLVRITRLGVLTQELANFI